MLAQNNRAKLHDHTLTTNRDDKPSANNMLSYLSPYKIRFEKSSLKNNLIEMLSFEHMNLVAENFMFIYIPSLCLCAYVISFKIGFKCHKCFDFSDKRGRHFVCRLAELCL